MPVNTARQVFLTFDVEGPKGREDHFTRESAEALLRVLAALKKFRLTGLFFITGTVAEKLSQYTEIVELLKGNLIGYHSSSHTIQPRIFEYTDVEDYQQALEISLKRETSSIDPNTGKIMGEGGILRLRRIFQNNNVKFFRAPFLCWAPPHIESLRDLGIRFDFSTGISDIPSQFKGLTFFPSPIVVDSIFEKVVSVVENQKRVLPRFLLKKMLSRQCTVLLMHPSKLICTDQVDRSASEHEVEVRFTKKSRSKLTLDLVALKMLFCELSILERTGAITITPSPRMTDHNLDAQKIDAEKLWKENALICKKLFNYKPTFMRNHFAQFFGCRKEL